MKHRNVTWFTSKAIRSAAAAAAFLATALLSAPTPVAAQQMTPEQQKLFLRGARLWPVYCSQCHQARPGSDYSPAQWDTIMMHMRNRANMPAKDARALLEYLKNSR